MKAQVRIEHRLRAERFSASRLSSGPVRVAASAGRFGDWSYIGNLAPEV